MTGANLADLATKYQGGQFSSAKLKYLEFPMITWSRRGMPSIWPDSRSRVVRALSWSEVAARVIVAANDGRRALSDRGAENFPRVNGCPGEGAP